MADRNGSTKDRRRLDISERDSLELIRFPSAEARLEAIGVLMERGMLNFTSFNDYDWYVRTPIARTLRQQGVAFEWLTENG